MLMIQKETVQETCLYWTLHKTISRLLRQSVGIYRYTTEKARSIVTTQNTYLVPDNSTYKGDLIGSFIVKEAAIQKVSSNALYNTKSKFSEVFVSVPSSALVFLESSFISQSQ